MKKLTRKLFVSIMTLVLTAMALGTSTFAWFSSSYQASATGLEVTAKTNAVCLLIDSQSTLATIQSNGKQSVVANYAYTSTNSGKKVFPAAYVTSDTTVGGIALSAGEWYTANNDEITSAVHTLSNVTKVNETDENYILKYQVWLTLAGQPDSSSEGYVSETTRKLKVTTTLNEAGTNEINTATSCVVVINDGSEQRLNISGAGNATTANAISINSGAVVSVTIYVYVDGNNAEVKTKNLIDGKKLTGTLGLQFDLVTSGN